MEESGPMVWDAGDPLRSTSGYPDGCRKSFMADSENIGRICLLILSRIRIYDLEKQEVLGQIPKKQKNWYLS